MRPTRHLGADRRDARVVVTAGETQEWEKSGAGKGFDRACKGENLEVWVGRKKSGVSGRQEQGRQRKESRTACFPGPTPPLKRFGPDPATTPTEPLYSRLRLHVTTSSGIAQICNPRLLQSCNRTYLSPVYIYCIYYVGSRSNTCAGRLRIVNSQSHKQLRLIQF